jgi:hypothetical protein
MLLDFTKTICEVKHPYDSFPTSPTVKQARQLGDIVIQTNWKKWNVIATSLILIGNTCNKKSWELQTNTSQPNS